MFKEIKELKYRKDNLIVQLDKNKQYLEEYNNSLEQCLNNIEHHKAAYKELEKIIVESNGIFIEKIEKLLNKALTSIFFDEEYELKIIVDNKKLSFELIDNKNMDDDNKPLQIDVEDACGGGIITVIGFILQIFIIQLLDLSRIIFIDEGFMAISSTYRPLFYEFLNKFCEETDTKIMLVSHDNLALEYAKNIFEIEHGKMIK
ncbi:MAG: hypothetical protein ACRC4T_19360 [Cetobacterium sp.]